MKTYHQNKFRKLSNETGSSLAMPSARYEEIPTRKLLTAYGGPGSIVETRNGAVLIEPFSEWPAFKKQPAHEQTIEDLRLVKRLRNWFPALQRLVQMPVNNLKDGFRPDEPQSTVKARYFPEWMFSPKTRRFAPLSEWHQHWVSITKKYNDTTAQDMFHPPKCWETYQAAKEGKEKSKYRELEQVRFVMISPNGYICDVPWDRWVFGRQNNKTDAAQLTETGHETDNEAGSGKIWLDFNRTIRKDVSYRYVASDTRSDLSGLWIIAIDSDGKEVARRSLAGLFNLRVPQKYLFPKAPFGNDLMKVVIRSSNSVYYANTISSLFLPVEKAELWPSAAIALVRKMHTQGKPVDRIANSLEDSQNLERTHTQIQQLISNEFVSPEENDTDYAESIYRQSEYDFITSKTARYQDPNGRLTFEAMPTLVEQLPGLKAIYRMDLLKLTTVQTSYTRQEPIDPMFYLTDDDASRQDDVVIRKRSTSRWPRKRIYFFPAVESFGEGIFFDFDPIRLVGWLSGEHRSAIEARTATIQANYNQNRMNRPSRQLTPQFVLIHTFSHLLIKELEFLCGYPATSLQERLYVGDSMQGVLIYTIAGAEGSYGGLTRLAQTGQIVTIVQSALRRALDCASDPICYHTGDDGHGQGVGGTNLAACYSCAMLPETSCEEYNRFLDRRLVIDEKFGFFKNAN